MRHVMITIQLKMVEEKETLDILFNVATGQNMLSEN